jgi:hypothetical protein
MNSVIYKKSLPTFFAALIALMIAGTLMTGKFFSIDFQLGASLSMTAVFGLVWIFGVRYPDVTWMLMTSVLLTVNNFLFPNHPPTKTSIAFFGTANFALTLSYGVFALSFFRFQMKPSAVGGVFLLNTGLFFCAAALLPLEALLSFGFDGSISVYAGACLLCAASIYGFTSLINLPPKRQRYVGIVAIASIAAAVALFGMGKTGNGGASSYSFFFNYVVASSFGMLLLADLIIFHRKNLNDITARLPSHDEENLENNASIGRTIQSLLLPKITQHDSDEFFSEIIFSPSDSFGGDWYFVIESSYDRKIITGDVAGSGVHGALGVAAIISLLHEARQRELDTQAIAKFINYRLIQLFDRKLSTTLTIISLAIDGTVEVCNCGGSGVLLLSRHGARHFNLNSTPLGLSYEPEIAISGLSLADNDIIIAASDGHFSHMADIKKLIDYLENQMDDLRDLRMVREAALNSGTRADAVDDQTLIIIQKRIIQTLQKSAS